MNDDREIRDLLASEIQDPDLRGRIFALLERDPATLTPQEQELVEHTVGGILSAETERLRAEAELLRGPSCWLPWLFRKPRPPSDPVGCQNSVTRFDLGICAEGFFRAAPQPGRRPSAPELVDHASTIRSMEQ